MDASIFSLPKLYSAFETRRDGEPFLVNSSLRHRAYPWASFHSSSQLITCELTASYSITSLVLDSEYLQFIKTEPYISKMPTKQKGKKGNRFGLWDRAYCGISKGVIISLKSIHDKINLNSKYTHRENKIGWLRCKPYNQADGISRALGTSLLGCNTW